MYYTNQLKITMRNEEMATKALAVLAKRLEAGFEYDKQYRYNPSFRMAEFLEVKDNTIVLPDECGCYVPEEANEVLSELMEVLATALKEEVFSCDCWNNETYSDSDFEAQYENGTLIIKAVLYPNGYTEFLYCDDCREEIVSLVEFDRNKKYYCSECGEELDLLEQYEEVKPIITEKEIVIK